MKILLYDAGSYTQADIMETLEEMGITYKNVFYRLNNVHEDAYFEKRIKQMLMAEKYDALLSVNYYPVLAGLCYSFSVPYLSWSYDSPLNIVNIEDTLDYRTNYIFFFDRAECQKYWRKGYENIYHLPLAVNTKRWDKVLITENDESRYGTDISMVGQLYESVLPDLMLPIDNYDRGYLNAIIETQLKLYGCFILDDVITEELIERMNSAYRGLGQTSLKLTKEGLGITTAKHITHLERSLLLDILGEYYQVHLYSSGTVEALANVNWKGSAGYFDEMPKIFKLSKINLNITLKCIQSGIPLRALDILGCGGFLLTNYQPEIAEYFVDGEEVVMYSSLEDAVAKCQYYLEHEDERTQIARNGYKKVCEMFSYKDRMQVMFEAAGLL